MYIEESELPAKPDKKELVFFAVDGGSVSNLRTLMGERMNSKLKKLFLLPTILIYRNNKDVSGELLVSFRSHSEELDWSKISILYGGGGHKKAASFRIKNADWESSIVANQLPLAGVVDMWNWMMEDDKLLKDCDPMDNHHLLVSKIIEKRKDQIITNVKSNLLEKA